MCKCRREVFREQHRIEGALKQLLTGVSHNVAQLLVDEEPATIESDMCNPNRSLFKGSTEAAFTGLEFVFKLLAFSDIGAHANPLTKISVLLEERHIILNNSISRCGPEELCVRPNERAIVFLAHIEVFFHAAMLGKGGALSRHDCRIHRR